MFAGYTIDRVLGAGGMATVYLAAHPRLPRRVALKLLHPELTRDDYVRSRFELEAEQAARLEHPNIVDVLDRGREGDQLWIAMQYVEGGSAGDAIRTDGAMAPDRAVFVIIETAKALDYATARVCCTMTSNPTTSCSSVTARIVAAGYCWPTSGLPRR